MMNHVKVCTQLRVILQEAVHSMRTVRDHLLRALPYSQSLECFNVFSSKLLKQQFVTDPPCGLTRATFEIAKHGEVDIRCLHESHNAASDFLQPAVVSRS